MARITITLSSKQDKITRKSPLLFRFVGGRDFIFRVKSGLYIAPNRWDSAKEEPIIPRLDTPERKDLVILQKKLDELKNLIIEAFTLADKATVNKAWIEQIIDKFHHPEKYERSSQTFFETFDEFLEKHKLSEVRKKNYRVVRRALQRYELYTQQIHGERFHLTLDNVKVDTLQDLEQFLKSEHQLCQDERFKVIYEAVPESRTPQPRGQNTLNDIFTKLRTFFRWAVDAERTSNNPFKFFKIQECLYGTPYYPSRDEYTTPIYPGIRNLPSNGIFSYSSVRSDAASGTF